MPLAPSAPSPKPILVVLHQETSTPGRIGYALRQRGYALDVRRPQFGDALPPSLGEHAGVIIFGGPMSANNSEDFVRREIEWIAVPLREKRPFLGICLGAQMLAAHLGSRIYKHPDGHAEVGYYPIRPTEIGREVCDPWPEQVYQWHREGFDLPLGAELLAEGELVPRAGFPPEHLRICAAISSRCHPRDDVPLDHPRARAHALAECQAAGGTFCGPGSL